MAKQPNRASVGVALIARNASKTLPACLQSIRPWVKQIVVGVDETTTDNTAKVARKHGADVVFPLQVSDWHECPRHGKVLAQHFANARNESFKRLDRSLDWWMWLDSDDVLKGGERLAEMLAQVPDDAAGVWNPYHYATLGGGKATNTLFHRERILRASIAWEWQYRVHEVVAPVGVQHPRWIMNDEIAVYHQEGQHKTDSSANRNLLLLEIDLEENPEDARAIFYMGNQYFAMGQWAAAAHWYERLGEVGKNPYELWQSYCYLSMAYEKLGDLDNATRAAFCAIDVEPRHPEPYLRLAAIYLLAGELDKVLYWSMQARDKEPPPFFVFKNPLDYTFNSRMPVADALAAQGRISEARAELEQAHAVYPDERVGEAIARYRNLEAAADHATAFARLAHGKTDEEVIALWETLKLPPEVRQFGRVRDLVAPALARLRAHSLSGRARIVFWCGRSMEEWYPGTLNTTGIGGSETAVVEIARRFAADGWRVDVYNGAGRYEGEYEGVGYWQPERLNLVEPADVFVSWRQPVPGLDLRIGPKNILWCHDLNYGPLPSATWLLWDAVLGVSQWHAGMLRQYYGLDEGKVDFVPNGVNLERFTTDVQRVPFHCVYTSSPDRGLLRLLDLWPHLVQREPSARLLIAYGWDNIDKAIAAGRSDLAAFKAEVERRLAETPNVVWRGRLPQDELARLFCESSAWLYPTSFLEVSCITAMEAMAGGCVPITSAVGALPETIGNAGVLVPGLPESRAWREFYLHTAYGVLCNPDLREPLRYAGRKRAESLTWDQSYAKWKEVVERVLSGKKELVGVA